MKKRHSFIWSNLFPWILLSLSVIVSGCVFHNTSLPSQNLSEIPQATNTDVYALLLPLHGQYASSGEAVRAGFTAAAKTKNMQQRVLVFDTTEDTIIHLYEKAVSQEATVIVGPLQKSEVSDFANEVTPAVPTLALNIIDKNIKKQNFYQFGLSPEDEIRDSLSRAWEDGQREAIIVVPETSWGVNIATLFANYWKAMGGTVLNTVTYKQNDVLPERIHLLLQTHSSPHTTILFAGSAKTARQMYPNFRLARGGNIPTYATAIVYSGKPDATADRDLDGIIFCDVPWVLDSTQPRYSALAGALNEDKGTHARLYALGLDAFSIATLLAQPSDHSWPIDGVTGILKMDLETKHIIRQLPCAEFRQGIPVVRSFASL